MRMLLFLALLFLLLFLFITTTHGLRGLKLEHHALVAQYLLLFVIKIWARIQGVTLGQQFVLFMFAFEQLLFEDLEPLVLWLFSRWRQLRGLNHPSHLRLIGITIQVILLRLLI